MKKYITHLKNEKKETFNIVFFSILLSTIINIISSAFLDAVKIKPIISVVVGMVITIILILGLVLYRTINLNGTVRFESAFIIDPNNKNEIISIPDYKISERMNDYLASAFIENKAVERIWNEGNFQSSFFTDANGKMTKTKKPDDSIALLIELIEYVILENFSTFVSDYFNRLHIKSKMVIEFSKETIPDILLSNRFLKLFSEEMKNRNAFVEDKYYNEDREGDVVYAVFNGATFRKFYLSMPKGTTIYRNNSNSISIDTKLFVLEIGYHFDGFSTVIENEFFEYYVGKDNIFNYDPYEFSITVKVKYKWSSVFKVTDWKYYNWLDEYLNELQHFCDKETFFEDIEWKSNKTMIQIVKNIRKNSKDL